MKSLLRNTLIQCAFAKFSFTWLNSLLHSIQCCHIEKIKSENSEWKSRFSSDDTQRWNFWVKSPKNWSLPWKKWWNLQWIYNVRKKFLTPAWIQTRDLLFWKYPHHSLPNGIFSWLSQFPYIFVYFSATTTQIIYKLLAHLCGVTLQLQSNFF